jgi:hypothetical protein
MTPSLSVEPPVFSKAVAHMQGGSKTTDDSAVEFLKKAGIIEKPGKLALSYRQFKPSSGTTMAISKKLSRRR